MSVRRSAPGWVVVAALRLGAVAAAQGQEAARAERRAKRALSDPVIDGALNDEAWQAPPLDTGEWLSHNPLHGDRIPQNTTVWFAYDDDYLYFAFQCADSDTKTQLASRASHSDCRSRAATSGYCRS